MIEKNLMIEMIMMIEMMMMIEMLMIEIIMFVLIFLRLEHQYNNTIRIFPEEGSSY